MRRSAAGKRFRVNTLRDDIADIDARLDDAERTARQLPHREKYLLLVLSFMRRLLDLHLEPVDQVEREFTTENHNRARTAAAQRR